ncbi:hypothetical protein [Aequorivita echinoideorum]|uniref:Lipoprotein n=1 Tax=Aequorivita echinoideorum TaxID=1549647 RepID=A0ABS5S2S3_9FLAO|nr:hypothetical protein [Aequorivita echinoideorum]MBT0607507.1 hypothetical protein [Aequorivita echinoideorum]
MKAFYLCIPLLMLNACKSPNTTSTTTEKNPTKMVSVKNQECPNGGTCTVKVQKNKKLMVQEDGTGALYPQIEAGDNMVVVYTYEKKGPEGTADGDYMETIHFEIPASTTNMNKEGVALKDVKMLFGRQCFCRDAGFYTIDNGKLLLEKNGNTISMDLKFTTDKTTQVISHISETVQI